MSRLRVAALSLAILATISSARGQDANAPAVDARLAEIARAHGAVASVVEIGKSRGGRPIQVVRLGAAPDPNAPPRAALLVVAGIDGRHRVGVETALRVAEKIATERGDLLDRATLYVLPCVNPDGLVRCAAKKGITDFGGTLSPDDLDRDARVDEDPPVDLNGDGYITNLLVFDPEPPLERTHLKDPDDPRLIRKAEREKGERPEFAVMTESADADQDGAFGEDGLEGVDLDKNFPHEWPEHAAHAGPFALSEPESLALVRWMLERSDIAAVLVFGPGDNLVNVPEAGKKAPAGAPIGLMQEDLAWHQEAAKKFTKITGMKHAKKQDQNGSFAGWAYAQFGVPTFATCVWGGPPEADDKKAASSPASAPDGAASKPEKDGKDGKDAKSDERKRSDDEKREIATIDDGVKRGGFVPYAPFQHPTLGHCEIGGLVPGFAQDAPDSELDRLANEQTQFVVSLIDRLPRVTVQPAVVKKLGDGAWRVSVAVANDGVLPTASAVGLEVRRLLPTVFRIEVPEAALLGGTRLQRSQKIDGGGGRARAEWVVAGAEGSSVEITVRSASLGERKMNVTLSETGR